MKKINTVLIIGAGPIVIGQSSEFDYSCSQACLACREYGKKVIMLNNNPATVSTDKKFADKIYFMPINIDSLESILQKNDIDGIMLSFGGQTALNLIFEIKTRGIDTKYNIDILGTSIESIKIAEDRKLFRDFLIQNDIPVIDTKIISHVHELDQNIKDEDFPLIVRSAFTLGGLGSGIAYNRSDLRSLFEKGKQYSPINQVMIDQSLLGYKEVEYEIIRDESDTCLSICNMENFDPVGVHTGESIVVAPSQTLDGVTHNKLRDVAFKIVRNLKIIGACNVQFALSSDHSKFYVIEINPRVSRSSALASKATSYPIAKIAAYICLGHRLKDIKNPINDKSAAFEPACDYIVTKIPKWPFDKFHFDINDERRKIGTQMQSTGEVMSISKNFQSSLLKGLISIYKSNPLQYGVFNDLSLEQIKISLENVDNLRIYRVFEALRMGLDLAIINQKTKITKYFIKQLCDIVNIEKEILNEFNIENIDKYYNAGFSSSVIQFYKKIMIKKEISYNIVDMFAGEFETKSNYYYSSFRKYNELKIDKKRKRIIIAGLGPTDIGNGIEFDYATTHAVLSLQKMGFEVVVLNNNPGTVSTDYNIADILCFDPVNKDYLLNLIHTIDYDGIMIQCGGQPAINCLIDAKGVNNDIKIFGTNLENTLKIEDRHKFYNTLDDLKINHPKYFVMQEMGDVNFSKNINFPVIIRPSFVIGGNGIEIVDSKNIFDRYIKRLSSLQDNVFPIVVDEYINGEEIEVDVVSDSENIFIPAVLECVEKAGIHPGDSIIVHNPNNQKKLIDKVYNIIEKICRELKVMGLINFQFIIKNDEIYLIEANPRASRSLCLVNKITQHNLIDYAMKVIAGQKIHDVVENISIGNFYAVKVPVFCFNKIQKIPMKLNASMKSTGEVLGLGLTYEEAVLKAMISAGFNFSKNKVKVYVKREMEKDIAYDLFAKMNIEMETYQLQDNNFIDKDSIVLDFDPNSDINYSQIGTVMYFCSIEKLEVYLHALLFFINNNIYSDIKCISDYFD
jgi:carbamoyl-phosphate synthase large subunit